ncbi:MAG: hypothetical protein GY725_01500 [bacterium]|nr:hypothetical protein [bacterium]
MKLACFVGIALVLAFAGMATADNTDRHVDSQVYSIHVDVASQVDMLELQLYLEEAQRLTVRSQDMGVEDDPCCTSLEAISLVTFGTTGDGLDVIDNATDWAALGSIRAIVMSINWCGSVVAGIAGCAQNPGSRMAVALDANPTVLGLVFAHERGHNGGLSHRESGTCTPMMSATAGSNHGCLDVSECNALRAQGSIGGNCGCLTGTVGDPPVANGAACVEDSVAGICHSYGLCSPTPANDLCANASVIADVDVLQTNERASTDGSATCGTTSTDIWYSYLPPCSGTVEVNLCDSGFDTVVSVHDECTGETTNETMCVDSCATISDCRSNGACVSIPVVYGQTELLRVGRGPGGPDPFVLRTDCTENPLLDSDSDLLTDVFEYGTLGTDPGDSDSDDDGLSDGEEYLTEGTDPLDADSDDDGLDDGAEVLTHNSDPLDSDSDDDGLDDATEVNTYGSNPNLADSDADGLDDGAELLPGSDGDSDLLINILDPDSDNDTFLDGADNCILFSNDQSDNGGVGSLIDPNASTPDGIGDACQCGDVNNDGRVDSLDAYNIAIDLIFPSAVINPTGLAKCVVHSASSSCDLLQKAVIERTVGSNGLAPGVQQLCSPAITP